MHSRAARLARGWVLGTVATATAALSHAFAGGSTPSGIALVVGIVFAGLLGTCAAGRTPSLPRLTVAVGGSQIAFHLLFSHLGTPATTAGTSVSSTMGTATAHLHGTYLLDSAVVPLSSHTAAHADSAWMWLAHTLAAVATLLFLRHAERSVWQLLTHLVRAVLVPFGGFLTLPVRATHSIPLARVHVQLLLGRLLGTAVSWRGPPRFA